MSVNPVDGMVKYQNMVFIYSTNVNGLGDISILRKIADFLVENKIFSRDTILVGSNCDLEKTPFFRANDADYTIIKDPLSAVVKNCALQIIFTDGEAKYLLQNCIPTLFLREYGYSPLPLLIQQKWILSKAFGLPNLDKADPNPPLGIILSKHLLFWNKIPKDKLKACKATLLESLRCKDLLLGNGSAEEFFDRNVIYAGYVKELLNYRAFVDHILSQFPENGKSVVFIFPTFRNFKGKIRSSYRVPDLAKLSAQGAFLAYQCFKGNRKFTIIIGSFSPEEMKTVWKISEDQVIVRGDQSAGEALSAKKYISYEADGHKDAFAASLHKMFGIPMLPFQFNMIKEPVSDVALETIDCTKPLIKAVDELMGKQVKVVNLIDQEDAHTKVSSYPPNTPVLLTIDQIRQLCINREGIVTAKAHEKEFAGVRFENEGIGKGIYMLYREQQVNQQASAYRGDASAEQKE